MVDDIAGPLAMGISGRGAEGVPGSMRPVNSRISRSRTCGERQCQRGDAADHSALSLMGEDDKAAQHQQEDSEGLPIAHSQERTTSRAAKASKPDPNALLVSACSTTPRHADLLIAATACGTR
jgi:hypothetical protein